MVECKTLEIRDRATSMVVFALKVFADSERVRRMLSSGGYGKTVREQSSYVFLSSNIRGGVNRMHEDPYDWGDRTYRSAHQYICDHWDEIPDGGLIDVRVALGEETTPVESEFILGDL